MDTGQLAKPTERDVSEVRSPRGMSQTQKRFAWFTNFVPSLGPGRLCLWTGYYQQIKRNTTQYLQYQYDFCPMKKSNYLLPMLLFGGAKPINIIGFLVLINCTLSGPLFSVHNVYVLASSYDLNWHSSLHISNNVFDQFPAIKNLLVLFSLRKTKVRVARHT